MKIRSGNRPGRRYALLAFVLAISMSWSYPVAAQEAICEYDVTARGRYYRVMSMTPATDSLPADTVEISQHIEEREAVLRGAIEKSMNPGNDVWINPDFVLTIECPPDWESQQLALDSIRVEPDSVHFVMAVDGSDTTWTALAFQEGERIDSVASKSYQLRALVFHDDSVVACSGSCDAYSQLPLLEYRQAMVEALPGAHDASAEPERRREPERLHFPMRLFSQ